MTRAEAAKAKAQADAKAKAARAKASACRNKCMKRVPSVERVKGWLSKPLPVTKHDLSKTVLSPRFCIS